MNETMESRFALLLPRISIAGFRDQASMARVTKPLSSSSITSEPTASLSWKTRPARMASMIAGVPPSSRWIGSAM